MTEYAQMSSYARLFDDGSNPELATKIGELFTHFHSQTIKQGGNLEQFIENFIKNETKFPFKEKQNKKYYNSLDNLDPVFKGKKNLLISKFFLPIKYFKQFNISCSNKTGVEIDFVVIKDGKINIIEMKAGKDFDTKKSAGEVESLMKVKSILTLIGFEVNNPIFVSYEAKKESDIILKTDIKECEKSTFIKFLMKFLTKEEAKKGKENIASQFRDKAEENLSYFYKKIDEIISKSSLTKSDTSNSNNDVPLQVFKKKSSSKNFVKPAKPKSNSSNNNKPIIIPPKKTIKFKVK